MENNVVNSKDALDAHRRWVLKKRQRAVRSVLKIADADLSQMAARTALRRRRRWQEPQTPRSNPVDQFRREVMPLVAQLVELAGGDPEPFLKLAKPKRRKSAATKRRPAGD